MLLYRVVFSNVFFFSSYSEDKDPGRFIHVSFKSSVLQLNILSNLMAYFYLYAFRKQNLRNDLAIEVQLLSKDLGITYKEVPAGPSAADKRFKSLTYTLKAS